MKKMIDLMRRIVDKHDEKHGLKKKKLFICTSIDTRNRYKLKEWRIPADKPQCPTFKDNRCCGGCDLAPSCDHAVDCGCFGYTYAVLGGDDEHKYMRPCSDYSKYGRIVDGKFDWNFYNFNKNKADYKIGTKVYVWHEEDTRDKLNISTEDYDFLKANDIRYGIIETDLSEDGHTVVKFSSYDASIQKILKVNITGLRRLG